MRFMCHAAVVRTCFQHSLAVLGLLTLIPSLSAQLTAPRLDILRPATSNGWVRLNSSFSSNTLFTLEASTNLAAWQSIGTLHDALFRYPDAGAPNFRQRFYRLRAAPRGPTNDWKNQIIFPTDSFRSTYSGQAILWVKFAILLNDPVRVIYQDSAKFPFHYDFATQRLAPFLGMDHVRFDSVSLHRTNQQVLLGAVLFAPGTNFVEYGIQFVGLDAYPPEEIGRWFELVKATVHTAGGAGIYYMPSFEQSEMTRTNAEAFTAQGIAVASIERWVAVNHIYAPGWALGRLKYFPASEIDAAFADGRLRPEDILLTDGVPAETPLVAGIISLTPSTPNSHTAILAQSFGIPFVYLPEAGDRARVQQLAGHKVILRAIITQDMGKVKVLDVEGALDPAVESELLALKRPEPIEFAPKTSFGAISASTDTLVPTDIQYFGGKAANYGLLRRAVPTNCPAAIAFSFDLWDAFLGQTLPGGQTLRAHIDARLAPYTNYPPDIASLKTNLAFIRNLFTRIARFTAEQQQAITNALGVFTPGRNIRFRSSTNVEDSEHFTGAGLYDSFSGCLLDDADGDTDGPSHCDPTEEEERGVFRAMQKVYASFYNDNAFLERLRHRVDEAKVGMGLLVHHSFPDEVELANGVATLQYRYGFFVTNYLVNMAGDLVTQLGAESVTNPDGTASPEVVDGAHYGSFLGVTLKQRSSRVPLGAYVLEWDEEYLAFLELFKRVGDDFLEFYPAKRNFHLDFEYKKDVNMGLVVKQVREIPNPNTTNQTIGFLIDEPTTWCVAQREAADVFANHRLKSIWTLHTSNMRLTSSNLTQGVYGEATFQYVEDDAIQTLSGPLSSWPNASNSPSGDFNYWTTGSGTNTRAWELETTITTSVTGSRPPIFTQDDFPKALGVIYATPAPKVFNNDPPATTTNELVFLEPCREAGPGAIPQQRIMSKSNVVTVQTSFYWPPPPGLAAGYTAPLIRFVETRITGLTTNPIVLTNYFSQTYRPGHHNFTEEFIFEPRLEPGLSPSILAELRAANIRLIHVWWGGEDVFVFNALGFDGTIRRL